MTLSSWVPKEPRLIQSRNSTTIVLAWDKRSTLQWRHNDHDGVSNHQPHGCLLNRLFGRRSKKASKLRATGLCAGKSPGPVNSPHKGPVTRKMFPFDDVIMPKPRCTWRTDRGLEYYIPVFLCWLVKILRSAPRFDRCWQANFHRTKTFNLIMSTCQYLWFTHCKFLTTDWFL